MHLFAGMPSISLTDVAKLRLENISFFLVGFLVSAFLIKLLWNYLAHDWTFLPRLSYGKALGLVTLWGFLFVLVLTMISGARELMTPGAWEKKGFTHQLVDEAKAQQLKERKHQLEKLREALWSYADEHEGSLPAAKSDSTIPAALWLVPHTAGAQYLYAARKHGNDGSPVAFEPELFGTDRLVLCTDGAIRIMTSDEIIQALPAEKK